MGIRARMVTGCVSALLAAGVVTAPVATATEPEPPPAMTEEIGGVCGTLLGVGTGTASLGKSVASRGAGWVSAIIAAGCLLKDLEEYQAAFRASPEGLAVVRDIKARYAGYTLDNWMRDFGCTFRETPPAHTDSAAAARGTWDCSTSPYANTD